MIFIVALAFLFVIHLAIYICWLTGLISFGAFLRREWLYAIVFFPIIGVLFLLLRATLSRIHEDVENIKKD